MKTSPRILLLLDWIPEEGSQLIESFRKTGMAFDTLGIDFHQSQWTPVNKIVSHWPQCFIASIRAFRKRRDYDYMIAWSQTMGTFLGLIKRLTGSDTPRIFILDAGIVERKNALLETVRRFIISAAWKKVDRIGFISNGYLQVIRRRFAIPENCCVHLKFPLIIENDPLYCGFTEGGYLFSAGRSYRDYQTLMAAARGSRHRFVVLTADFAIRGLSIPENVTVLRNVFGKDADRLLREAAAVIVPLERTASPAGELTLLEAMCYGKPVIVTETIVTKEYIVDGENGFLVPAGDPRAIVAAVDRLFSDPARACVIGHNARKTVMEEHAIDIFSRNVAAIVNGDLAGGGTV